MMTVMMLSGRWVKTHHITYPVSISYDTALIQTKTIQIVQFATVVKQ